MAHAATAVAAAAGAHHFGQCCSLCEGGRQGLQEHGLQEHTMEKQEKEAATEAG